MSKRKKRDSREDGEYRSSDSDGEIHPSPSKFTKTADEDSYWFTRCQDYMKENREFKTENSDLKKELEQLKVQCDSDRVINMEQELSSCKSKLEVYNMTPSERCDAIDKLVDSRKDQNLVKKQIEQIKELSTAVTDIQTKLEKERDARKEAEKKIRSLKKITDRSTSKSILQQKLKKKTKKITNLKKQVSILEKQNEKLKEQPSVSPSKSTAAADPTNQLAVFTSLLDSKEEENILLKQKVEQFEQSKRQEQQESPLTEIMRTSVRIQDLEKSEKEKDEQIEKLKYEFNSKVTEWEKRAEESEENVLIIETQKQNLAKQQKKIDQLRLDYCHLLELSTTLEKRMRSFMVPKSEVDKIKYEIRTKYINKFPQEINAIMSKIVPAAKDHSSISVQSAAVSNSPPASDNTWVSWRKLNPSTGDLSPPQQTDEKEQNTDLTVILNSEITELKERLQRAQEERNSLLQEKIGWEEEKIEYQIQMERLQETLDDVKSQLDIKTNQVVKEATAKSDLQQAVKHLTEEKKSAEKRYGLSHEYDKKKIKELSESEGKLKIEVGQKNDCIAELETESQRLQDRVLKAETDLGSCETMKLQLENDISEARKLNSEYESQIKGLKSDLSESQQSEIQLSDMKQLVNGFLVGLGNLLKKRGKVFKQQMGKFVRKYSPANNEYYNVLIPIVDQSKDLIAELESVEAKLSNEGMYWTAKVEQLDQTCRQVCDPELIQQAQLNEINNSGQQRLDFIIDIFSSYISSLTKNGQQLQTELDAAKNSLTQSNDQEKHLTDELQKMQNELDKKLAETKKWMAMSNSFMEKDGKLAEFGLKVAALETQNDTLRRRVRHLLRTSSNCATGSHGDVVNDAPANSNTIPPISLSAPSSLSRNDVTAHHSLPSSSSLKNEPV